MKPSEVYWEAACAVSKYPLGCCGIIAESAPAIASYRSCKNVANFSKYINGGSKYNYWYGTRFTSEEQADRFVALLLMHEIAKTEGLDDE